MVRRKRQQYKVAATQLQNGAPPTKLGRRDAATNFIVEMPVKVPREVMLSKLQVLQNKLRTVVDGSSDKITCARKVDVSGLSLDVNNLEPS